MRLSIYRGGYATLTSIEDVTDWDEFCDMVSTPVIGQKNGDYFIRGHCEGKRRDEGMRSADLIVIDGDQLLKNGGACCPPQDVHDVLCNNNIKHVIYNSYSNDLVNNKHKWRCCIPCDSIVDVETLKQGVEEVITLLHDNGLMVRNVKENIVLSQPWFLPRCNDGNIDDFYAAWHDGEKFELGRIPVKDTAKIQFNGTSCDGGGDGGCFSWEWVIGQFRAGTLHQGIKSACGWLIYTTDWADKQIKQHLVSIIRSVCPDKDKVRRACDGKEIDQLIKYCRGKHGVVEHSSNWKDHLISADVLKEKEFPPIKWAVDGVIPEGLTVLAGDPKCGKSLMAVDICSAIASGTSAFGHKECVEGVCVYCSFEDPERRVRSRIEVQCDEWPERFKLLTGGVPTVGTEFYRILDEMVLLWPDIRAIIIDTMQFIIPPKQSGVSDYDHYYHCLDPLHKWALTNNVAVVVITHKTKSRGADGDNPFASIIGSVAIQGTADAMLMLRKNHAKGSILDSEIADGFLDVVGREIGSETFSLDFDSEAMRWTMRGQVRTQDVTGNLNWLTITDALKKSRMKSVDISNVTKINRATVRSCLTRMSKKNLVSKFGNDGLWEVVGQDYESVSKW